jgi:Cu(I)/Ag(I) efflux system membrane protein CusA/SilA
MTDKLIRFCLENRFVVALFFILVILLGIVFAPFDLDTGTWLPRYPVAVDAIPDIGENQQIVFTEWPGRSPQDIEDQVTYPLTVSLLGVPGVKTIRSYSMFGFSTIYVIFSEDTEFYWSRSRILEKLNSLAPGMMPDDVKPALGPDATALGQVFWYTLEGQDAQGKTTGGWDLHELRSVQDWHVRYALMSAEGVSEVASVGGYVQEYQVDVDPDAMRVANVSIEEVMNAVRMANVDVGARSIEVNRAEYVIRGIGFIKSLSDIENAVVKVNDNVPIYVGTVARVTTGPEQRMGALDKQGAEAVGGVVVVRFGENPLRVIKNVKKKIAEIAPGLPKKTLADGTTSQVRIVPFYDRTGLIYETLATLDDALIGEVMVTIIVVLLMVMHLRSSVLISGLLPVAILLVFIAMKQFSVDANIVALSGIAIAIGTMVDLGVVITENILRHLEKARADAPVRETVFAAVSEVGSAVITAVATTIVSFLPVFTMEGAEGKLFRPLAYTKTFALAASIIVALTIIPPLAEMFFSTRINNDRIRRYFMYLLATAGIVLAVFFQFWTGLAVFLISLVHLREQDMANRLPFSRDFVVNALVLSIIFFLLVDHWQPLGPGKGMLRNFIFVVSLVGGIMLIFFTFQRYYERMLRWALLNKAKFLALPGAIIVFGMIIWLGLPALLGWLPVPVQTWKPMAKMIHAFPGLGKEFMPPLDEGSFLYMPTTMPHASIGEAMEVLQYQDASLAMVPEIQDVVGKIGRVESPLDPAPLSMIETLINYSNEYLSDSAGKRLYFAVNEDSADYFRSEAGIPQPGPDGQPYYVRGAFLRDHDGKLIPDNSGMPFRLWRPRLDPELNPGRAEWPGIRSASDIWQEIITAAEITGTTSAPELQPIATRLVMLQSGMRAPLGIKVKGPDLASIEQVGLRIEELLKEVPAIEPATVFADRIVGKPYLEIYIDRQAIARYGIMLEQVQNVIEVAVGGKKVTTTVEGRERYPVRVRYLRELRDTIESLQDILVPAPGGPQIPLKQLATIKYVRGPQMIRSEDTFLVGYVLFDKKPGYAEVDVVDQASVFLQQKLADGILDIPSGVSYAFAGSYENQVRAQKKLAVILPLALGVIFIILYLQFRSLATSALVFSGIAVAWAGGFILLWLYGQNWFMDFAVFGINLRDLFQMHTYNLSVAVWVGFLALFGIATDDGVLIATYLKQSVEKHRPETIDAVHRATIDAGLKRVRPALMTTATTVLALLPVLTSSGRGSDIMVPMAIPSFGGMLFAMITMFVVPVIYASVLESRVVRGKNQIK